jgi:glycosyltransferase involved in cell wall biosynthesis
MVHPAAQVSVLIPVFNRRELLREAALSALRQTESDIEIIIGDNASTDGTWAVCEELAALDPRVRVFRNDQNLGPVGNWKRCLEMARGTYGKILFSDDLLDSRFLERTLPLMRPDVGFVFSAIELGPERGKGWPALRWRLADGEYESYAFIRDVLYGGEVPVSPSAALFRLDDLRGNLVVNPAGTTLDFSSHGAGTDMLLFLLAARAYPRIGYVAEQLVFFRSHEGSITANPATRHRVLAAHNATRIWFAFRYVSLADAYRMLARAWLSSMAYVRHWVSPRQVAKEAGWERFTSASPLFALASLWELTRHHYWKLFRKSRRQA